MGGLVAWVHGLITCCSFFGPFDACMESGFVYDGDALLNLFAGEFSCVAVILDR